MIPDSVRLAMGTLTAIPVPAPARVDRRTARGSMLLAPLVGLLLGVATAGVVYLVRLAAAHATTPAGVAPLAAVIAVVTLTLLTRALHLDGLADTVDGFGVKGIGPDAVTRRLAVLRSPEVGAFGVVALVLVVLLQVSALALLIARGYGTLGLVVAVTTSRLAATWTVVAGIPPARPDGLGAVVAGTVPRFAAIGLTVLVAAGAAAVGLHDDDGSLRVALVSVAAVVGGLLVGALLLARCVRRFGGVTGDVIGAVVETTTTVVLVALALAL